MVAFACQSHLREELPSRKWLPAIVAVEPAERDNSAGIPLSKEKVSPARAGAGDIKKIRVEKTKKDALHLVRK